MTVSEETDWDFIFKFIMLFDTRKRHPQLFEAKLFLKSKFSAIN